MAEEKQSLHIDLDWKKQAQEEKRRLEEEEKKRADDAAAARQAASVTPAAVIPTTSSGAGGGSGAMTAGGSAGAAEMPGGAVAGRGSRTGTREVPEASFVTILNSLVTQTMLYLGEVPTSSGQTMMSLDMAKHQIDTLAVLEEKTRGNLTPEEQASLDVALYEVRMRFVSVAGQVIAGTN